MSKKMKVGIIGSGAVGSTTAYSLLLKELVDEINFIDNNEDLAKAQAADLLDAACVFNYDTVIKQGDYKDLKDFDVVVITASIPAKKLDDRLKLYEENKKLIIQITEELIANEYKGIYIIASNPVDILTKVCAQIVKDPTKVIGSGTILDSARLEREIANELNVNTDKIEANVIGEHGNGAVSLFSLVKVEGISLKEYIENKNINFDYEKVHTNMKNDGFYIFNIKGSTTFGIANSITKIIKAIALDTKEVLNVTAYVENNMRIQDVYIPVPRVIGKSGIEDIKEFDINETEQQELIDSANFLRSFE